MSREVKEEDLVLIEGEQEPVVFVTGVGSVVNADDARPLAFKLLFGLITDISSDRSSSVTLIEGLFGDADRLLLHFLGHA